VPSGWPEPGAACPDTLKPSLVSAAPSHVTITAPNAPGTGYGYTVLFVRDPEDGLTSMTAVSFTLDVVEPAPVDTTPPALLGVPADITVETHDAAGAVVTWPAPTATDDTDPAPVVGCTPASGSTFPVGASAVTCSATDASGNVASGTFTVTVLLVHVPQLSVRWAPPLGGPHPLIVGPHGRVVPVRVAITIDGTTWRPASGAAPELRLDRLAGCGGPGLLGVLSSASLGPMRWNDGRWMRRLDARSLAPGCWRLAVSMGGFDAGAATLVVTGEPPGRILAGLPRRPH
jgi:hypothetical protein